MLPYDGGSRNENRLALFGRLEHKPISLIQNDVNHIIGGQPLGKIKFVLISNSNESLLNTSQLENTDKYTNRKINIHELDQAEELVKRSRGATNIRNVTIVTSSDLSEDRSGLFAVDQNESTNWSGNPSEKGWWILLSFKEEQHVNTIELQLTETSLSESLILWSTDAKNWSEFNSSVSGNNITLKFLWIIFSDGKTEKFPEVQEVVIN